MSSCIDDGKPFHARRPATAASEAPICRRHGARPVGQQLRVQPRTRTLAGNTTLLAFAAERHAARRRCCWAVAAIDRYRLPAGPTAANRRALLQMGQTDRRISYCYTDPATYYASGVNNRSSLRPLRR